MHNLIPFNQLVEWKNSTENENDLVNDYYQCLIECDENQQICKRICKEVLGDTKMSSGFIMFLSNL